MKKIRRREVNQGSSNCCLKRRSRNSPPSRHQTVPISSIFESPKENPKIKNRKIIIIIITSKATILSSSSFSSVPPVPSSPPSHRPHPAIGVMVGRWTPVKNPDDPHLKEVEEFAVREYNKQLKATLELSRVIKAETQVVSGTNYRLVIDVQGSGGGSKSYEAVVLEKLWEHFMKLASFKPL